MSSSLLLSEFGVKTLVRCSANRIDILLVERTQLLSGFLRGGMGTIDLLNFFVAFHIEWSFVENSVMY
jgi:hypothetical protein